MDWFRRKARQVANQFSDVVTSVLHAAPPSAVEKAAKERASQPAAPPPPPAVPRPWYAWLFDALPLVMLAVGLLLAGICAHFSQTVVWAVLGFVLIGVSPCVWYLQRIDRRMEEWIALQRRWHE
jgi:Flp pilus assembly protein TadB